MPMSVDLLQYQMLRRADAAEATKIPGIGPEDMEEKRKPSDDVPV